MSQPLVSIAVCTFNGAKYLAEQLDSIINQTYKNLEVIIIDDQSSDQTVDILRTYLEKHSNFHIYENDANIGYIKNFEKAICLCNGEYIALADQDDVWVLNKIELQLQFIQDHIMVYHDSEFMDEVGNPLNRKMSDLRNFYSGNDPRHFLLENCVSGHSVMFKRELIPYLLPFPIELFHDWWIAFVATNHGYINFQKDLLVKYRQHSNTSTDMLQQKKTNYKKRSDRLTELIKKVKIFYQYPSDKHHKFIAKLLELLEKNISHSNYALSVFVWKHRSILLFIQKKNTWSKFNFCRKLRA